MDNKEAVHFMENTRERETIIYLGLGQVLPLYCADGPRIKSTR